MSRKLQFKRGVKAKLPVLAEGEPGWVIDEKKLYVGSGTGNVAMAPGEHTHKKSEITDFPAAVPPTAHAASHAKAGADPVSPSAIGAATAPAPVVVSFPVAGWVKNSATNCYEQTVACPGLLSSDDKRTTVSPVGSTDAAAQALTDAAEALVDRYACTTNGQLYARCPEKAPTVAFSVAVTIVRG